MDLLLCCGDFQSCRDLCDLHCCALPEKYRTMNSFYKYYSGEKTAPVLTVFVGGNHEASNHLRELYYGGWVAPNIYFLGMSGMIRFRGLRIAGVSGIFKQHDHSLGESSLPVFLTSLSCSCVRSLSHVVAFLSSCCCCRCCCCCRRRCRCFSVVTVKITNTNTNSSSSPGATLFVCQVHFVACYL